MASVNIFGDCKEWMAVMESGWASYPLRPSAFCPIFNLSQPQSALSPNISTSSIYIDLVHLADIQSGELHRASSAALFIYDFKTAVPRVSHRRSHNNNTLFSQYFH